MIDPRFWPWSRWYLGRSEFKGHARDPRMRPPAPKVIPLRWWAELARRFIRPVAPVPVKPHAHPVFTDRPLVWVNRLDHFPIEHGLPLMRRAGIGGMFVQILDGTEVVTLDTARVKQYRDAGITVFGWGWGKGVEPFQEGYAAACDTRMEGLAGYGFNAEKPYDATLQDGSWSREHYERSQKWMDGWLSYTQPALPLLVSTEPRTAMRHEVWQGAGAAYAPQAYPLENGANVDDVVMFGRSVGWSPASIVPLIQTHRTNNLLPNVARLVAEASAAGCGSVCLYPGDGALNEPQVWDAVGAFKR